MSKKKYTKEFIKAFTLLNSKLDSIDLARYLKLSASEIKQIREDLKLKGV